jgi:ubiquinone/menaquinone biosynthesis C-methylase UbiE
MSITLENQQLVNTYRKRAKHYDWLSRLYYLIGFRYTGYRKNAVKALGLNQGDTVVEIGCGTGANLPLLQEAVGPTGKIIGVDLTDAMLEQARQRVAQAGWKNAQLIQSDAENYAFPEGIDGIISTYALTLSNDFEKVFASGAQALKTGKRWILLDFRAPTAWPRWLVRLGLLLMRPFGSRMHMVDRHPWEVFPKYLEKVTMRNFYLGIVYIISGEAKPK